jgi:hypothetical protein
MATVTVQSVVAPRDGSQRTAGILQTYFIQRSRGAWPVDTPPT